ncbi:hypothetical protein ABHF91_16380 [Pseudaeromonas sp. ZJS20]|uniref:hypothetical protein n=1 Tax=Pseudaeromonas aegiceratis TaxID=3153928 RepID=UPI00390C7216
MESQENKLFAQAAHPLNWYEVAKLMHENAHALYDMHQGMVTYNDGVKSITRPTSNRSVFLLAAFALENLIKAFLIYENPSYIEGGKLSNQLLSSHKLSKLQKSVRKYRLPKELVMSLKRWRLESTLGQGIPVLPLFTEKQKNEQ